ncbi:MAG: hypothetical protein M1828_003374 [Chrysothrix sp. TS-e1954]|nr:MAG: hypothetical protein M1828_003374 [Chrysothrix sp. TS-e1954]
MAEVTPPVLHAPTSKERKYDRQLRLWAANGQAALEEAHVLLLNSGSGVAGVEALKNIVLPGIGQFTIADPSLVREADLGVNFFLEEEDLGKFRAESCCRLLEELNPDVKGHAITEPFEAFISKPDALSSYTHILVIQPCVPEISEAISEHAQRTSTPVFYIHSLGFYAHLTLQLPSAFPIVDTHPDPATTTDLRLLEPWAELTASMTKHTKDLESMDDETHGHVPYVYLLLYYLEKWKAGYDGKPPQNYSEKSAFRSMVREGARTKNAEGGEENYDEAVTNVLKNLNPHTPSSAVKEVFAAEECQNLTKHSPDFWVIAHAVSTFHQTHNLLPSSGALPDMKAKSADYIELQNIYRSKSRADIDEVTQNVRTLEGDLERSRPIPTSEIGTFCKSAGYIKLIRGRRPHVIKPGSLIDWGDRAKYACSKLTDPTSQLPIYLAFAAYDSYAASHSLEGQGQVGLEQRPLIPEDPTLETEKITGIAHTLVDGLIKAADSFIQDPEYSQVKVEVGKVVEELVRAQGGELHNIAAVVGGMVAQEVIKVVTRQYIPVDNTLVFDGCLSRTEVLRL